MDNSIKIPVWRPQEMAEAAADRHAGDPGRLSLALKGAEVLRIKQEAAARREVKRTDRPVRTDYLGRTLRMDSRSGQPVEAYVARTPNGKGRDWVTDVEQAETFATFDRAQRALRVDTRGGQVVKRHTYTDGTRRIEAVQPRNIGRGLA